jgi:hypothetical protein
MANGVFLTFSGFSLALAIMFPAVAILRKEASDASYLPTEPPRWTASSSLRTHSNRVNASVKDFCGAVVDLLDSEAGSRKLKDVRARMNEMLRFCVEVQQGMSAA